jgi:predicted nucleic acid-binding Zn ribbon protein
MSENDTKKCPFCAEEIKQEAVFCRYCKRDLSGNKEAAISSIDTKKCPLCGKEMEKQAATCQACGYNVEKVHRPKRGKTLYWVLGIVLLIGLLSSALKDKDTDRKSTSNSSPKKQSSTPISGKVCKTQKNALLFKSKEAWAACYSLDGDARLNMMTKMLDKEEALLEPDGTDVLVIETGWDPWVKIRVMGTEPFFWVHEQRLKCGQ